MTPINEAIHFRCLIFFPVPFHFQIEFIGVKQKESKYGGRGGSAFASSGSSARFRKNRTNIYINCEWRLQQMLNCLLEEMKYAVGQKPTLERLQCQVKSKYANDETKKPCINSYQEHAKTCIQRTFILSFDVI